MLIATGRDDVTAEETQPSLSTATLVARGLSVRL